MKQLMALCLSLFCLCAYAQNTDNTQPPFKRFPTLPPINILLTDSTTMFTKENFIKNKPVLLVLFSPECEHCQHEADELYKYRDSLSNVQIVMATMYPLWEVREFGAKYQLDQLPNVVMGKDIYYFMPSFFMIHNLPFLAFYDSKGNLITTFEGTMPLPRIVETFKDK